MPHPDHNFLFPHKSNLCPDSDDNLVLALLNSFAAQPFTSRHLVNLAHFSKSYLSIFYKIPSLSFSFRYTLRIKESDPLVCRLSLSLGFLDCMFVVLIDYNFCTLVAGCEDLVKLMFNPFGRTLRFYVLSLREYIMSGCFSFCDLLAVVDIQHLVPLIHWGSWWYCNNFFFYLLLGYFSKKPFLVIYIWLPSGIWTTVGLPLWLSW